MLGPPAATWRQLETAWQNEAGPDCTGCLGGSPLCYESDGGCLQSSVQDASFCRHSVSACVTELVCAQLWVIELQGACPQQGSGLPARRMFTSKTSVYQRDVCPPARSMSTTRCMSTRKMLVYQQGARLPARFLCACITGCEIAICLKPLAVFHIS